MEASFCMNSAISQRAKGGLVLRGQGYLLFPCGNRVFCKLYCSVESPYYQLCVKLPKNATLHLLWEPGLFRFSGDWLIMSWSGLLCGLDHLIRRIGFEFNEG